MSKKYKLPERYELIISEKSESFKIKDLQRNVISVKSFYLHQLESIISDYENNIKKLKVFDSTFTEDNEIDVIIKPGSKFNLFYKGKRVGKYDTVIECVNRIKDLKTWDEEFEIFKSKIQSLNNREEVNI